PADGRYIWFNSVMTVSGLPSSTTTTIKVVNASITFTANSTPYTIPVPNATITYAPGTLPVTTTFDTSTNTWVTHTSPTLSNTNTWVAGVPFLSPGLPGGINPVTWTADFQCNTAGVSLQWQWAAAVYTTFSTDYNALAVKPISSTSGDNYPNSDHAG